MIQRVARGCDAGRPTCAAASADAGDLVAVAVASGFEVGIDVEPIDPRRADLATLGRFLAPSELAAILASPAGDRPVLAATAWTRLEAEAKGRGRSLDRLRGRERSGSLRSLDVGAGHVGSLWTAAPVSVIPAAQPLLASVA